eukprot:11175059-Lingulodinium_polyedra.AAC.1
MPRADLQPKRGAAATEERDAVGPGFDARRQQSVARWSSSSGRLVFQRGQTLAGYVRSSKRSRRQGVRLGIRRE